MDNHQKGNLGEDFVKRYLEKDGFKVERRSHKASGYDLLARKNGKPLHIEVKTTKSEYGIPDMNSTEFKKTKRGLELVADRLYIVRLKGNKPSVMDILEKKEVNRFSKLHTIVYRIRTRKFQRALERGEVTRKQIKL